MLNMAEFRFDHYAKKISYGAIGDTPDDDTYGAKIQKLAGFGSTCANHERGNGPETIHKPVYKEDKCRILI